MRYTIKVNHFSFQLPSLFSSFFFGCPLGTFNFGYFFFVPWVVIFLDMRYRLFSARSLPLSIFFPCLPFSFSLLGLAHLGVCGCVCHPLGKLLLIFGAACFNLCSVCLYCLSRLFPFTVCCPATVQTG